MNTYALVMKETDLVYYPDSGPFDGKTLEDAELEVVETIKFTKAVGDTPREFLASVGLEVVPMTAAHEKQYGRGT